MPALPKRKPSTRRQGKRRATYQITPPSLVSCSHCGEPKPLHQVCPHCGYYKKSPVLTIESKEKKKKKD